MNQYPNQSPFPGQFQASPQKPPTPWRRFRARSRRFQLGVGCGIILGVLFLCTICGVIANALPNVPQTASSQQNTPTATTQTNQTAATSVATRASKPTPTPIPTKAPTPTPVPSHYPPKTKADLMALAAQGDANAIHEFHAESVGLVGACPQPKREVTVSSSLTGKQLAEDLLAYFYNNQLDSPCGSIVFVYHSQGEANGDGYTAGRINLDVTDASGSPNVDPNATGLKYTLTLDIGSFLTSQKEYIVNY